MEAAHAYEQSWLKNRQFRTDLIKNMNNNIFDFLIRIIKKRTPVSTHFLKEELLLALLYRLLFFPRSMWSRSPSKNKNIQATVPSDICTVRTTKQFFKINSVSEVQRYHGLMIWAARQDLYYTWFINNQLWVSGLSQRLHSCTILRSSKGTCYQASSNSDFFKDLRVTYILCEWLVLP